MRRTRIWLLASLWVASGASVAVSSDAAPPAMTRDDIICRSNSGVGFSYYWGGGCWCASGCNRNTACGAGSCSGGCPNCTHSGTYGADCSGFVTKVWQVPNPISTTTCGHGPYVANSYRSSTPYWNVISRSSLQRGDALASSTHVLIYEKGDPWGNMLVYEARGCAYGIVHNWRTCSSSYSAARRINITSGTTCACTAGHTQSEACGLCGTRTRTCTSACQWGTWTSCQGQGACSPGQKESGACGNCGARSRTCSSGCNWGAWSGCAGEGPCAAGASEASDCCDCGSQGRNCTSSCQWSEWSTCAGPDPSNGGEYCDTGELGPCASGTRRCVQGCLACARSYEPTAEVCDAIDNDCSGEVDDGQPAQLGDPPPPFAAQLVDVSQPSSLTPGGESTAWATFRNDGSATWRVGQIWLAAMNAAQGEASKLHDAATWPAWDVAAILDRDVAPGEDAWFVWKVRAPVERGTTVTERFRLMDPNGTLMQCPAPDVELSIRISGEPESEPATTPPIDEPAPQKSAATPETNEPKSGCSCRAEPSTSQSPWAVAIGMVLLVGRRVRRRRDTRAV